MNRFWQAIFMIALIVLTIVIGEMFYKTFRDVFGTAVVSCLVFLCGSFLIFERKDPK